MIPLLTAAEMGALDRYAIEVVGVPGVVLMETAGRGVLAHLWARYEGRARRGPVAVVCGRGNNGGDGLVVARGLADRGVAVQAYLLGTRGAVRGEAAVHLGAYVGGGGSLVEVDDAFPLGDALSRAALVVDAVVGTGLAEDLRGLAARAVAALNGATAPVVSVDLPSGVCADSGRCRGEAVRAELTVTFGWPKRGHYLYPGAAHVGRVAVVEIGIPPRALGTVAPGLWGLEATDLLGQLGRPADGHKGTFGHVVVLGGSPGQAGAPGLAAWGALRSGAGLATVVGPLGPGGTARLPLEVMTEPLPGDAWGPGVAALARRGTALVIGPGLGTGPGAREAVEALLGEAGAPAVLDADALNLLAADPAGWSRRRRAAVLTPHPGEAARLLGTNVGAVQADRVGAVRALAERFGCVAVLKGAGTLVAEPGSPVWLVPLGNPGMATAGTGDVLAGVVGALLGRGLSPLEGARLGAYAHARAGDLAAAARGQDGLTASDLLDHLPAALAELGPPSPTETP